MSFVEHRMNQVIFPLSNMFQFVREDVKNTTMKLLSYMDEMTSYSDWAFMIVHLDDGARYHRGVTFFGTALDIRRHISILVVNEHMY